MQVWYTILHGQCVSSLTSSKAAIAQSRLVLDVGSNFGYYSLYAAAHGCRWAIRGIRPSRMHIAPFHQCYPLKLASISQSMMLP